MNKQQKLEALKGLDERVANIDYEMEVNPDFNLPDDYYSCKRLAQSIREDMDESPTEEHPKCIT